MWRQTGQRRWLSMRGWYHEMPRRGIGSVLRLVHDQDAAWSSCPGCVGSMLTWSAVRLSWFPCLGLESFGLGCFSCGCFNWISDEYDANEICMLWPPLLRLHLCHLQCCRPIPTHASISCFVCLLRLCKSGWQNPIPKSPNLTVPTSVCQRTNFSTTSA